VANYLPEDRCFAIWDFVVEVLAREQNFGAGGPGTGTNSAGRLQTVAQVDKSTWPTFETFPYVGAQFRNFTEDTYGAQRFHKFQAYFDLIAIIQVQAANENVLQLGNAWDALRPIVNDGNGNGMFPILRDAQYYNLGYSASGQANCEMHQVTDLSFNWDEAPVGSGTIYVAFASATIRAEFTQQA
jgi:hypothetical protein